MSLTFFNQPASEKTETATPKKRQKSREEGQVAQSQEIATALLFIAGFLALRVFAPGMLTRLGGLLSLNFANAGSMANEYMTTGAMANFMVVIFGEIFMIFLPISGVIVLLMLLSGILQVGWKPTLKPLKPNFKKLSPLKGIKKIFGSKLLMELLKTFLKLALLAAVLFWVIAGEIDTLLNLFYYDLWEGIAYTAFLVTTVGITVGLFYLIIAVADYAYNKRKHEKEIRMTKQEVKDEYKQTEGDPLIKGKIRQKMRETSMRRMMQEVSGADVVITNPTHYAVALRYNNMIDAAPVVVAKGVDFMAQRIREKAQELNIAVVENPALARAIYADVDVGEEIPYELWGAVVEILAYVFKLKNRVS